MSDISATLNSLKNMISNLEKKIEPNEKPGSRVSPEEKLEIRLQKVNTSLESVFSRKEAMDRKILVELGRLMVEFHFHDFCHGKADFWKSVANSVLPWHSRLY
jgi:hypothetical protein